MAPHATCSRCSMVLVLAFIDGQHIPVCPRSSCEGHDQLAGALAGCEREPAGTPPPARRRAPRPPRRTA